MKSFNNILLIASLTLLLTACGEESAVSNPDKEYKIKGGFGLTMGKESKNLTKGYLEDNKAFDFSPEKPNPIFTTYTYSVTPNTHLIYGIKLKGPLNLSRKDCKTQRKTLIEETLAHLGESPTFKISDEGNKWKIRENNQREITIDCERALTADSLQLVMTYNDTALSKLSYTEWSKHQDDITKPQ